MNAERVIRLARAFRRGLMFFRGLNKVIAQDAKESGERWITIGHKEKTENSKGRKGQHVLLSGSGRVKSGLGGKAKGKTLSNALKSLKKKKVKTAGKKDAEEVPHAQATTQATTQATKETSEQKSLKNSFNQLLNSNLNTYQMFKNMRGIYRDRDLFDKTNKRFNDFIQTVNEVNKNAPSEKSNDMIRGLTEDVYNRVREVYKIVVDTHNTLDAEDRTDVLAQRLYLYRERLQDAFLKK